MKVSEAEFNSLKNRYNSLRGYCSSLEREIFELTEQVKKLRIDSEIDVCLRRYSEETK